MLRRLWHNQGAKGSIEIPRSSIGHVVFWWPSSSSPSEHTKASNHTWRFESSHVRSCWRKFTSFRTRLPVDANQGQFANFSFACFNILHWRCCFESVHLYSYFFNPDILISFGRCWSIYIFPTVGFVRFVPREKIYLEFERNCGKIVVGIVNLILSFFRHFFDRFTSFLTVGLVSCYKKVSRAWKNFYQFDFMFLKQFHALCWVKCKNSIALELSRFWPYWGKREEI